MVFVSLSSHFRNSCMKRLLIITLLCVLNLTIYAQHDGHKHDSQTVVSEVNSTPVADSSLILKEEIFDFGKIPQGKPVHHNFGIVNAGSLPLKLINVQASCGCTTPEWEKDKDIAAGESSIIKVGYNAASEGPFTKVITITYNENQTKQMTIKGEVWKTPSASAPSNSALNDLKD